MLNIADGYQNVDDRFCNEARHCRRAYMLNTRSDTGKSRSNPPPFNFEFLGPRYFVRHKLYIAPFASPDYFYFANGTS